MKDKKNADLKMLRLFYVTEDGNEEWHGIGFAYSEEEAIEASRLLFAATNGDQPRSLKAQCGDTAKEPLRSTLYLWEDIGLEAIGDGFSVMDVENDIISSETIIQAVLRVVTRHAREAVQKERKRMLAAIDRIEDSAGMSDGNMSISTALEYVRDSVKDGY